MKCTNRKTPYIRPWVYNRFQRPFLGHIFGGGLIFGSLVHGGIFIAGNFPKQNFDLAKTKNLSIKLIDNKVILGVNVRRWL